MCLLTFAYDTHPDYSLVFAGNRDEFYDRPTDPAGFWDEAPHVLAGRDLKAGGTWMGVTRNGHWGVVTNVRAPGAYRPDARSRGTLVSEYLLEEPNPKTYLQQIAQDAGAYNGFNLLLGTPDTLYYLSSKEGAVQSVAPGVHGLSNDQLDTPWPKVEAATTGLRDQIDEGPVNPETLLGLLDQRDPFSTERLPDTGVGTETERLLSPIFIDGDGYGTRCSTILLMDRMGTCTFVERTFDEGDIADTRRFSFPVG